MKDMKVVAGVVVVIIAIVAIVYFGLRKTPSVIEKFDHPIMPESDFNAMMQKVQGQNAIVWKDINADQTFILPDGSVDISELSGEGIKSFVSKKDGKNYFNASFEPVYTAMIEMLRNDKVNSELALTVMEPVTTDVIARFKQIPGVTDQEIANYRDGIKKLMEAAPIIQALYQKQVGTSPDDRIKAVTDADRELFDRYGHPWCLSDTSPFCVALPTLLKRTSGVIPESVTCDEANKIGSPYEGIIKDANGKWVPIAYSAMWPAEMDKIAGILRDAAGIFANIKREAKFTEYLKDIADSFQSKEPYPYAKSDITWADTLVSDSLLFFRIGADEVGGDGIGDNCENRARFHFNLGIKNQGAMEIVDRLKPAISQFEKKYSDMVGNPKDYVAREIQIHLPLFLDVIYANGDDIGGPNGTNIGQTLPNWCGADGKGECTRGTMIYVNKTLKAYSEKIMGDYIVKLFDEPTRKYFNAKLGLDSVVYHEVFHNLGPRDKQKKPGVEETYGGKLTTKDGESWRLPIEELKAQNGSLFMANEFYLDAINKHNAGQMDNAAFEEETNRYRQHVVYDMAWALRMILRASRNGPEFNSRNPYSRLATIQIGTLAEQGAIVFNPETKEWTVNFDKMPEAISYLTKKSAQMYAGTNVDEIEKWFLYYMKGDGEKLLHRDRLVEVAGKMPSVLFDYQLKGM